MIASRNALPFPMHVVRVGMHHHATRPAPLALPTPLFAAALRAAQKKATRLLRRLRAKLKESRRADRARRGVNW